MKDQAFRTVVQDLLDSIDEADEKGLIISDIREKAKMVKLAQQGIYV